MPRWTLSTIVPSGAPKVSPARNRALRLLGRLHGRRRALRRTGSQGSARRTLVARWHQTSGSILLGCPNAPHADESGQRRRGGVDSARVARERQPPDGRDAARSHTRQSHEPSGKQIESRASIYGKRYLLEPAPDHKLPKSGMSAEEAASLIEEEMVLDGLPTHNLATFVTTWMEPEADRVIGETLRVNFIDHAEYPQTAEIERRCIRMLADLFHAPGETTGARTQGP